MREDIVRWRADINMQMPRWLVENEMRGELLRIVGIYIIIIGIQDAAVALRDSRAG